MYSRNFWNIPVTAYIFVTFDKLLSFRYKFLLSPYAESTSVPVVLVPSYADILFSDGELLESTVGSKKLRYELFIILAVRPTQLRKSLH